MKIFTFLFASITTALTAVAAPLVPWGTNSIPDSVGWVFEFDGKRYDSELKRDALLSSPSWSSETPLPLSAGNAMAVARKQLGALVRDPSKWSAKEIQLLSANPLAETQHWYYAVHFLRTDRSEPNATRDYIIVCVDFKGRAGTFKLKSPELFTRYYFVPGTFMSRLQEALPPNAGESNQELLLRYLKTQNIEIVNPATLLLEETKQMLTVHATLAALDKIEKLVGKWQQP